MFCGKLKINGKRIGIHVIFWHIFKSVRERKKIYQGTTLPRSNIMLGITLVYQVWHVEVNGGWVVIISLGCQ